MLNIFWHLVHVKFNLVKFFAQRRRWAKNEKEIAQRLEWAKNNKKG